MKELIKYWIWKREVRKELNYWRKERRDYNLVFSHAVKEGIAEVYFSEIGEIDDKIKSLESLIIKKQ